MIKERLIKILEKGLEPNWYFVIKLINDGADLSTIESSKVLGWQMLAQRKGFLEYSGGVYKISDAGRELVSEVEAVRPKILSVENRVISIPREKENEKVTTLDSWAEELLKMLKAKLKERIGKETIMGFGGVYFIPSIHDLKEHLQRFNRKYKISLQDNKDKIEKILLKHVDTCGKTRSFSPAVKYFIIKEKTGSQLAAAIENWSEESKTEIHDYTTEG